MSIQKTPQGTYRARIRDRHGKQIGKTFKRMADARVWEMEQLRLRDEGDLILNRQGTVEQWSHQWLNASRQLSASTLEIYKKNLRLYIVPIIGDYRLAELTTDDVDRLLTYHLERGLAPSTVHRVYRIVRRMLAVAVERGRVSRNVADLVKPPRIPHREMRFLSVPELEQLADHIPDRYRSWVLVAGYGGLRWGEMLALRPGDFQGDELDVNAQLTLVDNEWKRTPTKSKLSKRRVPLPPSVAEELRYHIDRYPGDLIFTNANGGVISHSSFTGNVFKRALVKARLDRGVRIHDLRHTAVAIAIQAGAHPKVIQMRMGHASINVTLDTYGHLMPSMHSTLALDIEQLRQGEAAAVDIELGEEL